MATNISIDRITLHKLGDTDKVDVSYYFHLTEPMSLMMVDTVEDVALDEGNATYTAWLTDNAYTAVVTPDVPNNF